MKKPQLSGTTYVYRFAFFVSLLLFTTGLATTLQSGVKLQLGVFRILICVIVGFAVGLAIGNIFLSIAQDVMKKETDISKEAEELIGSESLELEPDDPDFVAPVDNELGDE